MSGQAVPGGLHCPNSQGGGLPISAFAPTRHVHVACPAACPSSGADLAIRAQCSRTSRPWPHPAEAAVLGSVESVGTLICLGWLRDLHPAPAVPLLCNPATLGRCTSTAAPWAMRMQLHRTSQSKPPAFCLSWQRPAEPGRPSVLRPDSESQGRTE